MGPIEGLTAQQVKDYIRWIANRRLLQLKLDEIYDVKDNPLRLDRQYVKRCRAHELL